MPEFAENETTAADNEQVEEEGSAQEVDLQALADKVYELLKEEARIERERRGSRWS
jgi:hypothetical protein